MAAELTCQTQIPDVPGLEPNDLTVGRVFDLECTGPWPADVQPDRLRVFTEKTDKPGGPRDDLMLKILDGKAVAKDTIQFKVTSYVAGKVQIPALVLTDGARKFQAGPLNFEVRSVLDPQQPKQEPYGPFGPLSMSIPLSWWIGLLVFILCLLGLLLTRVRRRLQRRGLLRRLKEHDSALSPSAEFYNRMRRLRREHGLFAGFAARPGEAAEVTKELEAMFRVYFMREFRVPALEWNDKALLRAFRHEHKMFFDEVGADIQKLFKEFGAAKASAKVDAKDAIQLSDATRTIVERIEKRQTKERA